jgi:DNA-binding IclR family transcriptional regulator
MFLGGVDVGSGPTTRHEILNTLRHEPGLTKSQLCRRLDLSWSSVWHHVHRLEEEGQVIRKNLYGWTGLYAASTPRLEMLLLPLLRDAAALSILGILREHPGSRIQDMARRSPLSRKQIRRRLGYLHAAGLVDRSDEFQAKFRVRDDVLEMARRQANIRLPLDGPVADGTGPRSNVLFSKQE